MKQLILLTCTILMCTHLFSQVAVPNIYDKGIDLISAERICNKMDTVPIQMLYTTKDDKVGRVTIGYIVRMVRYVSRSEKCDTNGMAVFGTDNLDTLDYDKMPIPSYYKVWEISYDKVCTNQYRRTPLKLIWVARERGTLRSLNGKRIQTIIYEANNRSAIAGIRRQQSKGLLERRSQPEQSRSSGADQ